jgi:hypothetical protein
MAKTSRPSAEPDARQPYDQQQTTAAQPEGKRYPPTPYSSAEDLRVRLEHAGLVK